MGRTKWHPISLDTALNERIIDRRVAKQLIAVHGDKAHLVALSYMLSEDTNQYRWRQVLDNIDELNKGESK
jgi:hypothetical protein